MHQNTLAARGFTPDPTEKASGISQQEPIEGERLIGSNISAKTC